MDVARLSSHQLASTSRPCIVSLNRQQPAVCRPSHHASSVFCSVSSDKVHIPCSSRPQRRSRTAVVPRAAKAVDPTPERPIRSIRDVNNGLILGFGADLSPDHPGYHDEEYKQRRAMIARSATQHQIGQPIPDIAYSPSEAAVWARVLRELTGQAQGDGLLARHACKEYLRALPVLDFREDHVPQLQEMSDALTAATGWRIRPVAGLMHPRHFLAGLAFKYFHSTQYIRHASRPDYTPEPDLCHELIGHVPLLGDPACASLIQAIGQASLAATTEAQIWHLTKIYWYTVEFGVVREQGQVKAFGAGILSSYGELAHMAAGGAVLEPFDPFTPQPKMSYKDGYQKRYFVMESFEEGERQLRAYAAHLQAQAQATIRPETMVLDNAHKPQPLAQVFSTFHSSAGSSPSSSPNILPYPSSEKVVVPRASGSATAGADAEAAPMTVGMLSRRERGQC